MNVLFGSLILLVALGPGTTLAGTLDAVKARGTLLVCHWPQYFGISFEHPRTGILQGIDIDMSKAFADDLGVNLEYVKTDFANFMDRLEAGDCDIAMMGAGVTPARQERVSFSAPYLRSDIYFITTKANTTLQSVEDLDQPGVVISVQKGTYMEPFSRDYFKNATLSIVSKPSEREIEVETGRADAFATDYPYSQRMLRNVDWARLISPTKELKTTDYAYAVRKGDPQWLATVNEFLIRVKQDGRLEQAARANNLLPILVRD
ncbi:substrate-binding periplasmic protein [Orrella daihaiensis]|uniref:Amino acid ABC transporter substrate-binding protein n=1 Tax=Orrella daihaiensis TaxID=2782176 RepID=A0ABY4AJ16_9BURK|nr:ABC transporter substrate-binding protein [Orrella daihaiensis]UOD50278.1 amino acid ABC transporter substrate-binding protein [Orrella daihaiensis]